MPMFEAEVLVNVPPERAFEAAIRPDVLLRISPPEMRLQFVEAPPAFEPETEFRFSVQMYGPAQHITHRIREFDRPLRFVEEQIEGPLRLWIHEHEFQLQADGTVLVIDRITFEPPGGFIGMLITPTRISDGLERGFDHRHRMLKRLLENESL